ncbi:hypothetical protein C6H64_22735 [Photorhabdus luminescens]|nr:hypothetical protein C6H64_22735 [Photorhabdus luminescens]
MFISHITDQSRIVSVTALTLYDKGKPVKLIGSLIFYLNAEQGMHSMVIYDCCCLFSIPFPRIISSYYYELAHT